MLSMAKNEANLTFTSFKLFDFVSETAVLHSIEFMELKRAKMNADHVRKLGFEL